MFSEPRNVLKRNTHPITTPSISTLFNFIRSLPIDTKSRLNLGGVSARLSGWPRISTSKAFDNVTCPYSKGSIRWRWLAPRYVAIKVNANNYASKDCAEKELRITQRITQANPTHEGRYFVRTLLDSFELLGPQGSHSCMVFEPLGEPLRMLKNRFQGAVLPPDVLRTIIRMVVSGLHYLHTQSCIIHTGRFNRSCTC